MKFIIRKSTKTPHKSTQKYQRRNWNISVATRSSQKYSCGNLKTTKVRKQHFYVTHKVHKKDTPGWLIVGSTDCHTSKISSIIDHHLSAKPLPSYVQDKPDSIKKLETVEDKLEYSILVTLDAWALTTRAREHRICEKIF